jgi:hypothetical protein
MIAPLLRHATGLLREDLEKAADAMTLAVESACQTLESCHRDVVHDPDAIAQLHDGATAAIMAAFAEYRWQQSRAWRLFREAMGVDAEEGSDGQA